MSKKKNNAMALYIYEALLGFSDIMMLLLSKYTISSDNVIIKIVSILYMIVTVLLMFFITTQLASNKVEIIEEKEDNKGLVTEVMKVCAMKRLPEFSNTVSAQVRKIEDRAQLINKMLKENFGDDDSRGEISELVKKYKETFYVNLEKIKTRVSILDISSNENLTVESSLKQEAKMVYESHMKYVSDKLNTNEKIVIELDKLLTELTRINDSEGDNNLNQLEDYTAALKKINDCTVEDENDDNLRSLMQKY